MKARARVLVSGFVQGVCFRAETRYNAIELGLTGWVRNTADGKVEAMFEGEKENVMKAIDFCRTGPSGARVENADVKWGKYTGEFVTFSIMR
jgi:acylphosphatase